MSRYFAIAAAIACLAPALGGCSSDSTSTDTTPVATGAAGEPAAPPAQEAGGNGSAAPRPRKAGSGQIPEGGGEGAPSAGGGGASSPPEYQPDDSLQTFGEEVEGRLKAQVSRAVLSFFRALAGPDYPGICARIAASNHRTIQEYAQLQRVPANSCAEVLEALMSPPNSLLRSSARSTITHVRVDGGEAIVFFRPPGGAVSYIQMVREGGRWKSVTLVPGTPINPVLGQR